MLESRYGPTNSSPLWPSPTEHSIPTGKDVHIWRASLEQPIAKVESLRQLLSADEQAKADRFHFEKDRRHFTVARAFLRKLLGHYLATAPAELRFTYSEYGKPQLAPGLTSDHARQLRFNLAHSGGLVLYAFTCAGEIGIDLEHIRTEFTGDDIARRFFSATEFACLDQLPATARHEAFFNCWTRKEAFIKAKGMGLSLALDQFDVTLTPNEPAALLATRWDPNEASRWSLEAIDVGPGFVGAVAVEGHDWQPSYWQVDEESL
jgi:4'-phosphopantetheinyl transferase